MSEKIIDLHVHSNASDGTLTPAEVIARALKEGVSAVALTDHDILSGLCEAMEAGRKTGVEVVPGCELSVQSPRGPLHILGLYVPPEGSRLEGVLGGLRKMRHSRNERIVTRLRELGMDIRYEEIKALAGGTVGRPHIAMAMVKKGFVPSLEAAFRQYLGSGGAAYVPKEKLTSEEAIRALREDGATVFLAHPFTMGISEDGLKTLLRELKEMGLEGVEAFYPEHSPGQTRFCLELARKEGLLVSGGSDFHGSNKPGLELGRGRGDLQVPFDVLDRIKEHRKKQGLWTEWSGGAGR
ncbi:MAG: PHP domain-containing protein [Desulfovibrionales bacterium]